MVWSVWGDKLLLYPVFYHTCQRMPLIRAVTQGRPSKPACFSCQSGDYEGCIAVAAYHIHPLGRADDGSAYRADILDAAVLAGAAPALGGRGGFAVTFPPPPPLLLIRMATCRFAAMSLNSGCRALQTAVSLSLLL